MPKTMSRLSTDDILIPVQVLIPEGGNATPTTDVVKFAFAPIGTPAPATTEFHPGFWLNTGSRLYAGITVGPHGTVSPGVGKWTVWVWIVDTPTEPVTPVDTLTIT